MLGDFVDVLVHLSSSPSREGERHALRDGRAAFARPRSLVCHDPECVQPIAQRAQFIGIAAPLTDRIGI